MCVCVYVVLCVCVCVLCDIYVCVCACVCATAMIPPCQALVDLLSVPPDSTPNLKLLVQVSSTIEKTSLALLAGAAPYQCNDHSHHPRLREGQARKFFDHHRPRGVVRLGRLRCVATTRVAAIANIFVVIVVVALVVAGTGNDFFCRCGRVDSSSLLEKCSIKTSFFTHRQY